MRSPWRVALILCMLVVAWSMTAAAQTHVPAEAGGKSLEMRLREQVEAVDALAQDRAAGTRGAQQAAAYWAQRLTDATGAPVYHQRFAITVPVLRACTAEVVAGEGAAGTAYPLYPYTPSGGQLAAFPGGRAEADVVYVGKGSLDELRGKVIARNIVAVDLDSANAWQTLGSLGARAIVFLGDEKSIATEFMNKWTAMPVGLPRFYADDAAFVAAVRGGDITRMRIAVDAAWRERPAENLLCLIPGQQTTPNLPNAKEGWTEQLVVISARYDASSHVVGRSPGATASANAAAVVELARRIVAMPDRCTVLIVLTSGDEWLFRGTRNFLELLRREESLADAVAHHEARAGELREIVSNAEAVVAGLERVAAGDLGVLAEASVRGAVKDELDRRTSAIEEKLQAARLHLRESPEDAARAAEVEALNTRKMASLGAAVAVARQGRLDQHRALVEDAAGGVLPLWQRELERRGGELKRRQEWIDIRKAVGDRVPLVMFEFSLTDGNGRYGFFPRSSFTQQNDYIGRVSSFANQFRGYLAAAEEAGAGRSRFDADTLRTDYTLESFLPIRRGFGTDMALARGQAAGAFVTVRDPTTPLDTPNDTPGALNWSNFAGQVQDVHDLLAGRPELGVMGPLQDPQFYGRSEVPNNSKSQKLRLFERTIGETIPRIGAPEHLVGGEEEKFATKWVPTLQGTRRLEWYTTHVDGAVEWVTVPREYLKLQAFAFHADGTVRRAISQQNTDQRGLVSGFTADPSRPQRVMVFDAQRLDLMDLFDPRYLDNLDRVQILDARRMDKPTDTAAHVRDGLGAVFMPPGIPWQLLVSKGDIGRRMVVINATPKKPSGQGFLTTDLAEIGPLSWRNAHDLYALNSARKADLERFGIANNLIRDLHAASGGYLKQADAGREKLDYAQWLGASAAAWSYQTQVYSNLISTSNGIIYGVIFLLLGIIPFSYFLERLVIGATDVYRQIGGFAVIFVLMTAALWFHPAFRISSAPIMILLAFLILILSSTVIYILYGRFEEEITRLRGAGSAAHATNLKRGAVLGAAIRLGLSNMRRRMTRTVLTLVTLVLLTFTLLCFTSVSESLRLTPSVVDEAPNPPARGIELRQRSWKGMPHSTLGLVRQVAGEGGVVARRYHLATESAELPWVLPVLPVDASGQATGKPYMASGLVGLEPAEARFHTVNIASVLPGWERLAAGEDVCFLADDVRADTDLKVGDTVEVIGARLTVAGFYSTEDFLKLRHFTGDELTPVDPKNSGAAPATTSSTSPEDLVAVDEQAYSFLSPIQVAVVPAEVARRLNGRLTSVMILPEDAEQAIPIAEDLARRSAFAVFASDGTQVRSLNAAASARPENLDMVLVPMLIAGVIVLNTMLGAVAERHREIHVYTSIGLAPSHVGTLFMAEAAALGTLGVVFGYIFGQGLATVLSHFELMSGVDLNYSSMAAIVTMGLVLALVMLSSLWPARTASRVAAPSLERHWRLPPANGDHLHVELPFTVNEEAARGVCAFVEEFFTTISQAGTGRFTADHIRTFAHENGEGIVKGLKARIWLAPYDLGVIQTLWLAIHPTQDAHVFEVRLTLIREAGNPGTWYRLNRPFLVEIRKQFLLWRAVTPELVQKYVARSDAMFARSEHALPPENEAPADDGAHRLAQSRTN